MQESLNDILNKLNGLNTGDLLCLDREDAWIGQKLENGKVKLTKKLGKWGTSLEPISAIGSTSFATSKGTSRKFKDDFGSDESLKAKKRNTERKNNAIRGQEDLLGITLFLIDEDKNSGTRRINTDTHDWKVSYSSEGHEIWYEIEKKYQDEMVPKTGEPRFIKIPENKELIKLDLGPGKLMGKINL